MSLSPYALSEGYTYSVQSPDGGWYPYMIPGDSNNPGIATEALQAILRRTGHNFEERVVPERDAKMAFQSGFIDIEWVSPDWLPGRQLPPDELGTMPVLPIREIIVHIPEKPEYRAGIDSLNGKQVGTVLGYSYATSDRFHRFDALNERSLIRMLKKRRLEVAIMADLSARYWARIHNAELVFGPVYSDSKMVLRIKKRNAHLLPGLNNAIEDLLQDGTIQEIIEKYTGKME